MSPKLSIIIPVFNEKENLRKTLRIIQALVTVPHEVLIVYDFEEDDSIPIVKDIQLSYPEVRLVRNQNRGVAPAIRTGISESFGEYALILTADDFGPVLSIEDMLIIMDRGCDLLNLTRYAYGGAVVGGSYLQRFLSWSANKLFFMFKRTVTDATMGVKIFRLDTIRTLTLKTNAGWAIGFELLIKAHLARFRIGEIPIISINRVGRGGKSHFTIGPWLKEYLRLFFWGIKHIRKITLVYRPKR